ncbi:MAG: carbohydrate ABC transporter substrate-binding protein [Lachnospiraceae bacterium]|nr:carbohydrate ABC transporter substrate-binding protein [Lachnospiraceae bacterium]
MKKKLVSIMMASTMVASVLAGCGSSSGGAASTQASSDSTQAAAADTQAAAADTEAAADTSAASADEGKVFNIQCWNTEFQSRITDHYPGYEKVDDTTGKIGDVTVKWHITPSDDNAYQNNLDSILPDNESASADDKTDLFLMEADYAKKYVNSDVTMNIADLGITDDQIADQYQYTKDIVKDENGNLKGLSWQAASAGLIYNRQAAKDVLGTDDPDKVQDAVSDWDKFNSLAEKMKAKGYTMCSVNDTYRVYSNNVSGPWVQDGKVVVDDNIKKWADDSKTLADKGEENTYELWSDDWAKGKYPDGKVFCYFGPAWFFNFSLAADDASSIAAKGGWGYVQGPQPYYWGGTWIAAATGTDNPTLVKDIMLKITTDPDIMKEIAQKDSDCVNNKTVLKELASDDSGNLALLGGENPYAMLAEGADKVDMSNISDYDQGCNEEFQTAMKGYFDGSYKTYDDALAAFNKAITEKYPDVTTD